jgi:replicative DNA helicase
MGSTNKIAAAVEAEQGVISSMMQSSRAIADAVERIGNEPAEWFSVAVNLTIYNLIVETWSAGKNFDITLFIQALEDRKLLETLGGRGHVLGLSYFVPSPANLPMYLETLSEKRWVRHVARTGETLIKLAAHNSDDVEGLLSTTEAALFDVANRHQTRSRRREIKEIVHDVIHNLGEPEKVLGISTGFSKLDKLVGGLAEGHNIVVAGKISGGKSALVQQIADSVAVTRKIKVAFFTFEMSADQTVQRIIQIRSEVSTRAVAEGNAEMLDVNQYREAAMEVAEAPLHIISERIDIAGIRARCMMLKPRVAIIDYLQIVPEKKQKNESTTEKLDRMSAEVKQIAHQLGITTILLTQLNKQDTTYGSQGITADADQLWVIEGGGEDDEGKTVVAKQIKVAKQRDGGRMAVQFSFVRNITKFRQKN